MNKEGLVKKIYKKLNMTQLESTDVLNIVFDAMIDTLSTGEEILIQDFGKLSPVKRASRVTTNPQTHEKLVIDEFNTVTFKPGKSLKEKVNEIRL